ncbi:MAG TPA: pentapeptide repeat-containing protein [Streptosporangiaceae bacterium]|jgi:uncharacterized protein YjbI with pentapeptide repeats|nr:pentapeptide repeat-containing protein [Streptosporangiaceae bacterium]
MPGKLLTRPVRAVIAASAVVAGMLALPAGAASAAVTCPTVNPSTGAVTPGPTPGADWSGCNLTGAFLYDMHLSGMNLTGANLTNATMLFSAVSSNLTDANLSGANMTGVNLTGANVSGAIMATANLDNVWTFSTTGVPASLPAGWEDVKDYILGPTANLTYATLKGQDLAGDDLDQANLSHADLAGANLSGTDLAQATLDGVQSGGITGTPSLPSGWQLLDGYLVGSGANLGGASLPNADLANADLSSTDFEGADLTGANLAGTDLTLADLDSANLSQASLTNADAEGATLVGTNLTSSTVTGATLTNTSLKQAELAGTDLSQATLTGVQSGGITTSGTAPTLPTSWSLADGYLLGPSADLASASLSGLSLSGANLIGANLTGAELSDASLPSVDLTSANLSSADLTGAALTSGDLTDTNLTDANLTNASLDKATVISAVLTGVTWLNTTCPDGSNSNAYDAGCFSPLNTTPPVADPHLLSGGSEVNGWFNAPVTVQWDWTDAGPLNYAKCTLDSTTTTSGPITLTASCTDLAGHRATDSYKLKVDTTSPVVMVTGVAGQAHYVLGNVPKAGCTTTETISGVAQAAKATVSTGGSHGVGPFTATCAGAVSVAGIPQHAPVQAKYTVGYGFGGFSAPKPGSTIARSSRDITARFRLVNAAGTAISATTAGNLAWAHDVRVTLRGPGISPASAFCTWSTSAKALSCALKIPAKVLTGRKYTLTAGENLGTGFYAAPVVGHVVNPETIYFK